MERLDRLGAAPGIKDALADLIRDGIAVLKENIDEQLIAAVIRDFEAYCRSHEESAEYRDRFGLHERLCNLQMVSPAVQALALNARTTELLRLVFGRPPLVVGSLFFEKGSQQSIHRDGPAFFTRPISHFFGVWNALEDVTADCGPLTYYAGGHRAVSDRALRASGVAPKDYFQAVIDDCEARKLEKRSLLPRKGETLIWHPELPHGGAPIADPAQSRRSLVFHYIPVGVPLYGPKQFFGAAAPSAAGPNYATLQLGGGHFYRHDGPKFFHNYVEGNFDEI